MGRQKKKDRKKEKQNRNENRKRIREKEKEELEMEYILELNVVISSLKSRLKASAIPLTMRKNPASTKATREKNLICILKFQRLR